MNIPNLYFPKQYESKTTANLQNSPFSRLGNVFLQLSNVYKDAYARVTCAYISENNIIFREILLAC